jgi:putative ABC transport system permease protein
MRKVEMAIYLAAKELWRNRGRFFLISLVIALITTLVLFIAALAQGLGAGNTEYLDKLNADLIVYQKNVDLSASSSRIDRGKLNDIRRVAGVKAVGPIGFSSVSIILEKADKPLDVSLIGVEPGQPGEPPVLAGRSLKNTRGKEAIIDRNTALRSGLKAGDKFAIKSIQGTKEEYYTLTVAGVTDGRQYFIRPSIVVPFLTWDEIRPQPALDDKQVNSASADLTSNVVAVQLENPGDWKAMAHRLENQVSNVEAVDRKTAYQATPGYSAQQSTLDTQRNFALLIGVLVIGGFFQIQTLQKVAQIGMLKAIGTSNLTIAAASVMQIAAVTVLGVAIGSLGTLALSLSLPPVIPVVFTPNSALIAIVSLLLIGPIGGLVSIRHSLKVEPLIALGLA